MPIFLTRMSRFNSQAPDPSFVLTQTIGGSGDGPNSWVPATCMGKLDWIPVPGFRPVPASVADRYLGSYTGNLSFLFLKNKTKQNKTRSPHSLLLPKISCPHFAFVVTILSQANILKMAPARHSAAGHVTPLSCPWLAHWSRQSVSRLSGQCSRREKGSSRVESAFPTDAPFIANSQTTHTSRRNHVWREKKRFLYFPESEINEKQYGHIKFVTKGDNNAVDDQGFYK